MSELFERLASANNPLAISGLFYVENESHLDLGTNDGISLKGLDSSKITCVELYGPAVAALQQSGFKEVIQEDALVTILEFIENGKKFDVVTAFDFLEHLTRAEGETLLDLLPQVYERALLLFVPLETEELVQTGEYQQHMKSLYDNIPQDHHYLQTHRSKWTAEDFRQRGFDCYLLKDFHMPGFDALFACKYTSNYDRDLVRRNFTKFAEKKALIFGNFGVQSIIREPAWVAGHEHIFIGNQVSIAARARLEAVTNHKGTEHFPYLIIEDGVTIELDCHIGAAEYVKIGKNSMIAGRVTIIDHDHEYEDINLPPRDQPLNTAPVIVGEDCWIGENVYVGKGVTIGKHSVVGANAVVTKDIPAYSVVVGAPATIIKQYRDNRWIDVRGWPIPLPYVNKRKKHSMSIIIPVRDNFALTERCLANLEMYTDEDFELLIIDNGSTDETANFPVAVRNEENLGFAKAINQGLEKASGDVLCIMNNDTMVGFSQWLPSILNIFDNYESVGLVGPVSNNGSGIQTVPFKGTEETFPQYCKEWMLHRDGQVMSVIRLAGFCMFISRELYDVIGKFDEQFFNYEDDDYSLRSLLSGFKNYLSIGTYVYHKGQSTFTSENIDWTQAMESSKKLFCKKWGSPLDNPYAITNKDVPLYIG